MSAAAGQEEAAAHAAAGHAPWDGRTEVHRAERIQRSDYVRQLDEEGDGDPAGMRHACWSIDRLLSSHRQERLRPTCRQCVERGLNWGDGTALVLSALATSPAPARSFCSM